LPAARAPSTIPGMPGATDIDPALVAPHEARPIRFLRRERCGAWRLKLYGIALPGRTPRDDLVDAAVDLAADVFPSPAAGEDRYGVGFVIVHDSATVGFALYHWWQGANECHHRAYASPLDDPSALAKIEDPAVGCVWELAVIDFESRAWLQDVLANADGPDLDRYLARTLDADV
jgi:hypothetical protein